MLLYFLFNIKRKGVVKPPTFSLSNEYLSKIKNISKDTHRLLISRDKICWKVKLATRLNDHVISGKMDCGGWNEWDGLWTEGNKHETWSMKCGLNEMRWNMISEV